MEEIFDKTEMIKTLEKKYKNIIWDIERNVDLWDVEFTFHAMCPLNGCKIAWKSPSLDLARKFNLEEILLFTAENAVRALSRAMFYREENFYEHGI